VAHVKHIASYYAVPRDFGEHEIILRKEEARHIRVNRSRVGDRIIITDGQGHACAGEITAIHRDSVVASVLEKLANQKEPAFSLTLAVAIPKKQRLEWIVEKGTEIGVNQFIPLVTARTVATADSAKTARLERVALAAMKQSCRSVLPQISPPTSLPSLTKSQQHFDICLIADEQSLAEEKRDWLQSEIWPASKTGIVAIGPEGGFSDAEVEAALNAGWLPLYMGARRLRTETAALVAATLVLARAGDLS